MTATSTVEGDKMSGLVLQLNDYRLTTAHIVYRLPDCPSLLQEYVWQELDLAPKYPQLMKFLDFWEGNLEGRLHSVRVASCDVIKPPRVDVQNTVARLILH
jgi:uncharacterized protein Usg